MFITYPAVFTQDYDYGGFVVTFPDFPEAITQGDNFEEAIIMAMDALESTLEIYQETSKDIPKARAANKNEVYVTIYRGEND